MEIPDLHKCRGRWRLCRWHGSPADKKPYRHGRQRRSGRLRRAYRRSSGTLFLPACGRWPALRRWFPVTNCSPIRRIAISTPLRISGSPLLPMMRFRERERLVSLWVDTSFPVNSSPGGGVDEQRRAAANVRLPVAVADFVADQRIAGGFIRNTQQGFRQAHQRHPFL